MLIVIAALLIPMRVSYGAGSLRCGSPVNLVDDQEPSELVRDCRDGMIGVRLPATVAAVVGVLLGSGTAWLLASFVRTRRWARLAATVGLGLWWFIVTAIGIVWMTTPAAPL